MQWSASICRKEETLKNYGKNNKELNALIEKKFQNSSEKELQHFQEMKISDDESKKSISSFAESVESGEISASDELFVTCWNDNSENKKGKPIKNYLDLLLILV